MTPALIPGIDYARAKDRRHRKVAASTGLPVSALCMAGCEAGVKAKCVYCSRLLCFSDMERETCRKAPIYGKHRT